MISPKQSTSKEAFKWEGKTMKLRQSTTKLVGTMRRPLRVGYMSKHKHHMTLTTKLGKDQLILNIVLLYSIHFASLSII
jgi:hypothetical protein